MKQAGAAVERREEIYARPEKQNILPGKQCPGGTSSNERRKLPGNLVHGGFAKSSVDSG